MSMVRRLAAAAREQRFSSGVSRRLGHFIEPFLEACYRWSLGLSRTASSPLLAITMSGDFAARPLAANLKEAFDRTLTGSGRLPLFVHEMTGMSGQKYRAFINDLIGSIADPRYLEIGSYMGSTAASAICGNTMKAVSIDNWSLFGGPKSAFLANIERVLSPEVDFKFIESDFRAVDYAALGRFNVYLFDGPHEEQDQHDGIVVPQTAFDDCFVLIVDDWNWPASRLGTFSAIQQARYSIACAIEVRNSLDGSPLEGGNWHNGYFFAVLVKPT